MILPTEEVIATILKVISATTKVILTTEEVITATLKVMLPTTIFRHIINSTNIANSVAAQIISKLTNLTNNILHDDLTFIDLYNSVSIAVFLRIHRALQTNNFFVAKYSHLNVYCQMYFQFCKSYSMFQIMPCHALPYCKNHYTITNINTNI